ncbi:MAG: DUF481 domain-containing protein [Planctomycetes bacterium]|nr:DUF481 domain-containing protein [Planctomycetota bacterium]
MSRIVASAFFLAAAACAALHADEIIMSNGDTLTGEIVTLAADRLVFKTSYAGEISIHWPGVWAVRTVKPIPVETASGDRLAATVSFAAPGELRLTPRGAAGGDLLIPVAEVAFMGRDASDEAAARRLMERTSPDVLASAAKWSGTLDVSYTAHSGNSRDAVIAARAKLARESKRDRLTVAALYEYGEESDVANVGKGLLSLRYDYRHRPKFFSWYELKEEHDHFADISLRTTSAAGLGVRMPSRENLTVDFRAGLAYVDTNNADPVPDESTAGTLTGLELTWNISKGFQFVQTVTWEYGFDAGDHRIHAETTLRRKLSEHLSLRLSFIDDYDSDPAPGREENDVTLFAGIGFAF